MPETFGARMREARERQQIALSTIADQTKIKLSLLESMEGDDVSHWPSGIFRRAFIRAYAHAIGLEPDIVVREFLELYPDRPQVFADAATGVPVEDARATDGASMRLKYLVASAFGSVSRLRARTNHKPERVVEPRMSVPDVSDSAEAPALDPAVAITEELVADVLPVNATSMPAVSPPMEAPAPAAPECPLVVPASLESDVVPVSLHEPAVSATTLEPPRSTLDAGRSAYDPDFTAVAHLCMELSCVHTTADVEPLLQEMTKLFGAVGVIVWMWDPIANELRPALFHGYSEGVVSQLPRVDRDTSNATAAAFRAARVCVVKGNDVDNGALAVPLLSPGGCIGVLAIELPEHREDYESVRAQAMIFAAQLAMLGGSAQPMEASDRMRA